MKFKKEFERRLLKLRNSIDYYFETGYENNLMPCLFSLFSYLWTFKAKGAYKKN